MIHTLFAYNQWANARILTMAELLSAEQFAAPMISDLPSIRDLLVHILSAQRTWLMRCRELESPGALNGSDFPDLKTLRQAWDNTEADTQAFVATLNDSLLARTIHYVNSQGEPNSYPLWQILVHQVNHAAQHRSEVALMLTQLGYSPGLLDFLVFIDSQTA